MASRRAATRHVRRCGDPHQRFSALRPLASRGTFPLLPQGKPLRRSPCAFRPAAKPAAQRAGGALAVAPGEGERAERARGASVKCHQDRASWRNCTKIRFTHPGCEELHPDYEVDLGQAAPESPRMLKRRVARAPRFRGGQACPPCIWNDNVVRPFQNFASLIRTAKNFNRPREANSGQSAPEESRMLKRGAARLCPPYKRSCGSAN